MTTAAQSTMRAEPTAEAHTMRCLEVWGGNQAVNNGVVMAGLDAWLYSRPFKNQSAGGDIHFVSSCAAGLLTRALIADVSGHGEAVAAAVDKLRALMRRYVNYVDQARLVGELNAEFTAITQAGGFATAVVASYMASRDEFTLCNAGHPRPLWYRSRQRDWSLMPERRPDTPGLSNVPLGIAEPACYDKATTRLATGDIVVLYTDSLTEARDPDGRMVGEDGLLDIARTLDPAEPADFLHALLAAVAARAGGDFDQDDVTVLILRPNGLKIRPTPGVMLRSMARLANAAADSLRPRGPEFPWPDEGALAALAGVLNRVNPRWGAPRRKSP